MISADTRIKGGWLLIAIALGAAMVLLLSATSRGSTLNDPACGVRRASESPPPRAQAAALNAETTMAQRELSASGVPRDESQVLARWYASYAKELKRIVLHPPGGTAASQEFRRARTAQLIEQIERLRLELGRRTALWVGESLPEAYLDGLKIGDKQARDAGVRPPRGKDSPFAGSFSVVDRRPLQILARDTLVDLNTSLDGAAKRAASVLRRTAQMGLAEADVNRVVAGGIVKGQPAQAVRELRDELQKVHGETVPVRDKNGNMMNFRARDYAEMVVRTKTREAVVTARHERLEEVGIDLVAIIGRVSTNPCTAFLGMVFSLSGKSDKYPAYDTLPSGGPPFHPNCSKGTRPFIDRLATPKQLKLAAGVEDAEKLLGKDFSEAGRLFKDLQLHAAVRQSYATTADKLFD